MSALDPVLPPVHGLVDREGRLVEAGPRLEELNARAGGMLGEAFAECGYDIATFEVVPSHGVHSPAGDVTFPDPTGYDVIVPLGARWPVYDEARRKTWVGAEM